MLRGGKFEQEISQEAYKAPNQRSANLDGYVYDPSLSDVKTAVFVSNPDRTVIIGHRGTKLTDTEDLADDLAIATGTFNLTSRYKRALKTNDKARAKYPDYNLVNVGHSLGAKVASEVAKKQYIGNSKAVTFAQPTTIPDIVTNTYDKVKCAINSKSNYCKKLKNQETNVTKYDPISSLARISAPGKVKTHKVKGKDPHTLANFNGGCLVGDPNCNCADYFDL